MKNTMQPGRAINLLAIAASLLVLNLCASYAAASHVYVVKTDRINEVQAWYRQKGYTVQHKNAQKGFLIVSPKSQAGASAAASGVTPLATPASGVQYALPLDPNTRFTLPTAAATPSAAVSAGAAASAASDDVSAASASVAAAAAPAQASAGACPVNLNPMPYPEDQGSCTRGKECTNWGVQSVAAATPEMQAIATAGKDDVLHCLLSSGVDITHPDLAGNVYGCTPGMKHAGSDKPVTCRHDYTFSPYLYGTSQAGMLAAPRNNVGVVGVTPGAAVYVNNIFGNATDPCATGPTWKDISNAVEDCYAAFQARKATINKRDLKLVVTLAVSDTVSTVTLPRPACTTPLPPRNISEEYEQLFNFATVLNLYGSQPDVMLIGMSGDSGQLGVSYPAVFPEIVSVTATTELYTATTPTMSVKNEWAAPGQLLLSPAVKVDPWVGPRAKIAFAAGSNWTAPADDLMLMVSPEPRPTIAYAEYGVELATGDVTAEVVFVGFAKDPEEFAGKNATGKICLAQRGGAVYFWEKVINGTNAGCAAVVVMNRDDVPPCEVLSAGVPGIIGYTNMQFAPPRPGGYPISMAIANRQGNAIKAAMAANPKVQLTVSRYIDSTPPNVGFSSQSGVAASMAAGSAALVWMAHKDCSAQAIRNAVGQSAYKLPGMGMAKRDMVFGYGFIQIDAAVKYLNENPCTPRPPSPSPSPSPSPPPPTYSVTLTSNASKTPKVGDTVIFTAKLSTNSPGASIEGRAVNFFLLGSSSPRVLCGKLSGTTDANGTVTTTCQLVQAGGVVMRAQGPGILNPKPISFIVKKK